MSNYPPGVSESTPNAPWNNGADDAELLRQKIVGFLDDADSCLRNLTDNLKALEALDKDGFYQHIRHKGDVGPRNHDRFGSLGLLAEDIEVWLLNSSQEDD